MDTNDIATRYLACWNEPDPSARAALVERTWTEDATYTDPLADVAGHAQLSATMGAVQAQFPDFVFTPVGAVDAHHRVARFGWCFGPVGGEPAVVGFDVVTTGADGRIERVVGFLDKVPA